MNTIIYGNNCLGLRGIYFYLDKKKYPCYKVAINKNKIKFRKQFPYTPEGLEQAKKWRLEKEMELFGEYAPRS